MPQARAHTPVRIEREGNPHWPLPPDYHNRDPEYQRIARVNASSLWRLKDATREEAIASWAFFREHYLLPDEEENFNPGFYDPPVKPPAPGHYHLVGWIHDHNFLAVGAPRHWAKSTTKRSIFVHRLVTGYYYKITSVVAKEDFGLKEVHYVRTQLEMNDRILADFGELRPTKGTGIWNMHQLILNNGCEFVILSVDGKKRGTRGTLNVCDDIEFDEDYKSRGPAVLAKLKEELLRVIVPMGGKGSKILLLGTMVSKQSLHYQIVCTDDDPRFLSKMRGGLWHKVNIPAFDAAGRNAWASQYTEEYLHEKRTTMGESFFRTEYMGDPRSEEDAPFTISLACEYTLDGRHPACDSLLLPQTHTATVSSPGEPPVSKPISALLAESHVFMCVDYAEGLTTAHDYSALVVCALDRSATLWVLDCWQGRVRSPKLADIVWQYAARWGCRTIGIEAVAAQMEVYRMVRQHFFLRSGSTDWQPTVYPLKHPANLSKGDRISAMESRFNQNKIKFPKPSAVPGHKSFPILFQQVRDFTPDLRGLATDDLVDALAMCHFAVRHAIEGQDPTRKEVSPLERILAGELHMPGTAIPWASMLPEGLPPAVENVMLYHQYEKVRREALAQMCDLPPFLWGPEGTQLVNVPSEEYIV